MYAKQPKTFEIFCFLLEFMIFLLLFRLVNLVVPEKVTIGSDGLQNETTERCCLSPGGDVGAAHDLLLFGFQCK